MNSVEDLVVVLDDFYGHDHRHIHEFNAVDMRFGLDHKIYEVCLFL